MTDVLEFAPPDLAADPFVHSRIVPLYGSDFIVDRGEHAFRLEPTLETTDVVDELVAVPPEEVLVAGCLKQEFSRFADLYNGAMDQARRLHITLPTMDAMNNTDIFPTQGLGTADLSFSIVHSPGKDGATLIRPYIANYIRGVSSLSNLPETYAHDATIHFLRTKYLPGPSFKAFQYLGKDAFRLSQQDAEAGQEYLCLLGSTLDNVTGRDIPNPYPPSDDGLITAIMRQARDCARRNYPYGAVIYAGASKIIDRLDTAITSGDSIIDWENKNWTQHYERVVQCLEGFQIPQVLAES